MEISRIIDLARGEKVTVRILDNGTPVIHPKPSPALLKIIKGHRDDVIAAAMRGLFDSHVEETVFKCDQCHSWIYERRGAAYLCDHANLCSQLRLLENE